MFCQLCGKKLIRKRYKYCSNKCQQDFQYKVYIEKWKQGEVSGNRGLTTRNISAYLRRYLVKKYGDACIICGWKTRHPSTNIVPLEVDHINGNAEDNTEENLRLICPNCHSLTSSFRNLNKGNGRSWRLRNIKKQAELAE